MTTPCRGYESDKEFCELEVLYRDRNPGFFILTRSHDDKTIGDVRHEILTSVWPNNPIDDPHNRLGLYILEENGDDEIPCHLKDSNLVKDVLMRLNKSGRVAIFRIANQEQGDQQ